MNVLSEKQRLELDSMIRINGLIVTTRKRLEEYYGDTGKYNCTIEKNDLIDVWNVIKDNGIIIRDTDNANDGLRFIFNYIYEIVEIVRNKPPDHLFKTARFYGNMDVPPVINYVKREHLFGHIIYNREFRPGTFMIIDGNAVNFRGIGTKSNNVPLAKEIYSKLNIVTSPKCTVPYS